MSSRAQELEAFLRSQLERIVYGQDKAIHALTIALIGGGHVLLEGAPGLGKTLLSQTFARALGGTFRRVQGTADLMPSDLTGVHVFDSHKNDFVFRPGPLFGDVVLVDEVNRAGPKTQSALLEAMEERSVTVDGHRFTLPRDFLIVATQNPREFEGTYPLPESQLDRFMLSLNIDYPPRADEQRIVREYVLPGSRPDGDTAVAELPADMLAAARQELTDVYLADALIGYVLDIATASRQSAHIGLGLSSRGALALARCARIEAALRGGDFVTPDDVQQVAPWIMRHRLMLTPDAVLDNVTAAGEVGRLLDSVAVPREGLAAD